MSNPNREAGDYFERSTKAALTAVGWLTIRAAGSLGVADVWAARDGVLLLISVKINGLMSPAEREALQVAAQIAGVGALPVMAYRDAELSRGWVSLTIVDGTPRPPRWDQLKVPPRARPGPGHAAT